MTVPAEIHTRNARMEENRMKKLFALLLVFALTIALAGCTMNAPTADREPDGETGDSGGGSATSFTIGYTPQSMEFSYFQDVVKGMQDQADESGYDVEIIVKDPQMDAANQVTAAEELVTAGSQLVIVCSVDLAAMPPIVDYIKNEKGLPLIAHQSPFEGADCYVSIEDYSFGKTGGDAVGKYIADQMGGQAKIAILHGKTVGENLEQRYQGYVDGIREFAPDVEIVAEAAGYEEEMAMEALSTILTEHPDIDIVIGTNDPGQLGAYAAVEAAGLTGQIKVCGIGSEQRILEYVRDGKILYSVGDGAYETGRLLMEDSIKMLNGEAVEKEQPIECQLIDADTAVEMLGRS